jgi:hypothetical protein
LLLPREAGYHFEQLPHASRLFQTKLSVSLGGLSFCFRDSPKSGAETPFRAPPIAENIRSNPVEPWEITVGGRAVAPLPGD